MITIVDRSYGTYGTADSCYTELAAFSDVGYRHARTLNAGHPKTLRANQFPGEKPFLKHGIASILLIQELMMNQDKALRTHLKKVLDWEDAHVNFDTAVEGIPQNMRGIRPPGFPYSLWEMLEHIRICQFDILDFCRNREYKDRAMENFWPKSTSPAEEEWDASIAAFQKDRQTLIELVEDTNTDLFASIPHGQGQTYLRELLLVADHNAYHVADLVAIRRSLGIWK